MAVAKTVDHQTAKFNSLQNFPAIRQLASQTVASAYLCGYTITLWISTTIFAHNKEMMLYYSYHNKVTLFTYNNSLEYFKAVYSKVPDIDVSILVVQ